MNFIVNAIDARYDTISVTYEVTAFAEQDPEVVRVLCDEAIRRGTLPAEYRLGITSPSIAVRRGDPADRQTARWAGELFA